MDGTDTLFEHGACGILHHELILSQGLCTGLTSTSPIGARTVRSSASAASLSFAPRAVPAGPAATQVITLTNSGGGAALRSRAQPSRDATSTASFTRTTTCAGLFRRRGCTFTRDVRSHCRRRTLPRTLTIVTNGGTLTVALTGTGVINTVATGAPTISDTTPTEGTAITAALGTRGRCQRCSWCGRVRVAPEHHTGRRGQHRHRRCNDGVVHADAGSGQPSPHGDGDLRRQRRHGRSTDISNHDRGW